MGIGSAGIKPAPELAIRQDGMGRTTVLGSTEGFDSQGQLLDRDLFFYSRNSFSSNSEKAHCGHGNSGSVLEKAFLIVIQVMTAHDARTESLVEDIQRCLDPWRGILQYFPDG